MARSKINSQSKDLLTDNGAVLLSVVEGEQIRLNFTVGWITNLTNYTITAVVVEADSSTLDYELSELPTNIQSGGQVTTLTIIDSVTTDNEFEIVVPKSLSTSWVTQPLPEKPVYGWIELEIKDSGTGDNQLIWKPLRGLVEVLFSPVDEV